MKKFDVLSDCALDDLKVSKEEVEACIKKEELDTRGYSVSEQITTAITIILNRKAIEAQRDTDWARCQEIIRDIFEEFERKCRYLGFGFSPMPRAMIIGIKAYQSLKSKYIKEEK